MLKFSVRLLAVMAAFFVLHATPAMAQATRTWISGVGDDANPCSRTAPCKTWAGAISKTAPGGEINCIDPGGFGGVTITKSITLRCDGALAGTLVSGTNAIIVNAAATDRVVLDSIDFEGVTTGLNAVNILQARDVVIINSRIRGFQGSPGNGVLVNGSSNNKIRVVITNSYFVGNVIGVKVASPDGRANVTITNTLIDASDVAGVSTSGGAGNTVSISGSTIINTPQPLQIGAGTTINSYGDNIIGPGGDNPTPVTKK